MDDIDDYLAFDGEDIELTDASDFDQTDVAVTLGEIASIYEEEALF